jgi:hypothetical protein
MEEGGMIAIPNKKLALERKWKGGKMKKSKKRGEELVISKIEITNPVETPIEHIQGKEEEKKEESNRSLSLKQYHSHVEEVGKRIYKLVIKECPTNLITAKMAVMHAAHLVEKKLREMKSN